MRWCLLLIAFSCGRFYGHGYAPDATAEEHFQEAMLALENEGCPGFLFIDPQASTSVTRIPGDIEHTDDDNICGWWRPGRVAFGSSQEVGCQSLLHEIAHSLGYDHQDGDLNYTFMWSYGAWQPLEQQAYQFANLTGCR